MKLYNLFLATMLAATSAYAATDPFVGTWVYNAQKSPKPTIRYAIKDLGDGHYALTGSTGVTVEIKGDGAAIQPEAGVLVSFKQLDDHDWQMDRDDGQKMVRTYTISGDDKTLTLHDVFAGNPDNNYELTTKYARLSPGKSIFGEWQSISMVEKTTGEAMKLVIKPFGTGGLSIGRPGDKHLSEMNFDGKTYADIGPGDKPGHTSSGKRVTDRLLEVDSQLNGKLEESEEARVSEDGKTLTIVSRVPNASAVFTIIWDKQ